MALAVPEQQPETFKGLPFDGIAVPAGLVTAKDIDHVRNGWDLFEQTLPPGMKGFIDGSIQDPFDKRHLARRDTVAILANSMRDWTKKATQKVRDGKVRPEDWKDWASVAFHQQMLTAAAVQGGGTRVLDSPTLQRRLAAVQANHELRMGSLQQRLLLGPDHPDGISLAQANAWGAQAQRGLIRTAGQMGAAESFGDRPVRRGMTAFEAHCLTCPSKAGLYTNLRECIEKCGGWVGDGSDQCHGNCLCYVRPASITSVYGDDMGKSLKVRLADLPPVAPAGGAAVTAPRLREGRSESGSGGAPLPAGEPPQPEPLPERVARMLIGFNALLAGIDGYEESVTLRLDGSLIGRRRGRPGETAFTLPAEGGAEVVVTHNHEWGTSFSPTDFASASASGIYELEASWRGGGVEVVYRLQRPADGWPAVAEVNRVLEAFVATEQAVKAEHEDWDEREVSHEVANRVASQLGVGYSREQRPVR